MDIINATEQSNLLIFKSEASTLDTTEISIKSSSDISMIEPIIQQKNFNALELDFSNFSTFNLDNSKFKNHDNDQALNLEHILDSINNSSVNIEDNKIEDSYKEYVKYEIDNIKAKIKILNSMNDNDLQVASILSNASNPNLVNENFYDCIEINDSYIVAQAEALKEIQKIINKSPHNVEASIKTMRASLEERLNTLEDKDFIRYVMEDSRFIEYIEAQMDKNIVATQLEEDKMSAQYDDWVTVDSDSSFIEKDSDATYDVSFDALDYIKYDIIKTLYQIEDLVKNFVTKVKSSIDYGVEIATEGAARQGAALLDTIAETNIAQLALNTIKSSISSLDFLHKSIIFESSSIYEWSKLKLGFSEKLKANNKDDSYFATTFHCKNDEDFSAKYEDISTKCEDSLEIASNLSVIYIDDVYIVAA